MRAPALRRLAAVVGLFGGGLALVAFAVMVTGADTARAGLGVSGNADLAASDAVGLTGGEAVIGAFAVGLRARTTREDH